MTEPGKIDVQRLRDIARTYRSLVICVGLQWAAAWASSSMRPAGAQSDDPGIGGIFLLAAFVLAIVLAIKGYRLARLLDRSVPALWAIAMFIPLINLIALLSLSRTSQAVCKQHGIHVGFLGPDLHDIKRLEDASRGQAGVPR